MVEWLGHDFRVSQSLCFKARLSAKQVIWKWVFILMKIKLIIKKGFASFWTLRCLEFGSGLLSTELMMRDFCRREQSWLSKDGVLGKLLFIFKTYYKARQCVITIHDSSAYYNIRQRVITICDSLVITILDNCYYNLRQILQFTTLLQFTTEQSSP